MNTILGNIAEQENAELFALLPQEQKNIVFSDNFCDIEPSFLGFIGYYKRLSEMIPEHFTVVDLGCAYNAQCFYFLNHKKYISVDSSDCAKFKSDNCEIYHKSIQDFIRDDIRGLNLEETFAILNYVPMRKDENKKVRETFRNLFVYYPHGGRNMMKEIYNKISNK